MTVIKKLRKALNTLEGLEADLEAELDLATANTDKPVIKQGLKEVRDMYAELCNRIKAIEAAEPEYREER